MRICEHFGLPIVEDDPYGELRFEGEDLPSLISFETTAPIIYSGTASKIMAPGMRIAWLVIADEEIREKIVLAKQGADLHSGTFAQYVFHEYARDGKAFDAHVRRIARTYSHRRGVMAEALVAIHARRRALHSPGGRHVSLGDAYRASTRPNCCKSRPDRKSFSCRASTSIPDATYTTGCG